jgi:hypothetical protein
MAAPSESKAAFLVLVQVPPAQAGVDASDSSEGNDARRGQVNDRHILLAADPGTGQLKVPAVSVGGAEAVPALKEAAAQLWGKLPEVYALLPSVVSVTSCADGDVFVASITVDPESNDYRCGAGEGSDSGGLVWLPFADRAGEFPRNLEQANVPVSQHGAIRAAFLHVFKPVIPQDSQPQQQQQQQHQPQQQAPGGKYVPRHLRQGGAPSAVPPPPTSTNPWRKDQHA